MPAGQSPTPGESPGPLVGFGRAADVYDIGNGRVVRRNRSGESTLREAEIMRHLSTHGYPVPEVYDADGADLVMERLHGATMLECFPRAPWKLPSWARMLAGLHDRLADVPMPEFDLPNRFGRPEVLVHLDLHPDNVFLTDRGPVVIDWPNTGAGPRGADVASTWLIMATSDVEGGRAVRTAVSAARSAFVRMFLRQAGRDIARELLPAVAEHRLVDRNLRPGEAANIRRLVVNEGHSAPDIAP